MTYIDCPDKKEKHPHYENRMGNLDKHYFFSPKDFHDTRKISSRKKLLKSFSRIAMCLNEKEPKDLPEGKLEKVCLVLINDYHKEKIYKLDVGPLNDGYIFAINLKRMNFDIFYLYNPNCEVYATFLEYFMKNTTKTLTVYYTGRNSDGNQGIMCAKETKVPKNLISNIVASNCNGKAHYIFVNDSPGGGTNFDIPTILKQNKPISNIISVSADETECSTKERRRTHGLLTFYLCKTLTNYPGISPNELIEKMKHEFRRFTLKFQCSITDQELANTPIFFS